MYDNQGNPFPNTNVIHEYLPILALTFKVAQGQIQQHVWTWHTQGTGIYDFLLLGSV